MSTSMLFYAKHISLLLALLFFTISFFWISFVFFNNILTIMTSNLFQILFELLASKSNMVRRDFTGRTEYSITSFFWASHSKFCFMLCRLFWNLFPLLVLLVILRIPFIDWPHLSTSTKDYSRNICKFTFIYYLVIFFSHDWSYLNCFKILSTLSLRAFHNLVFRIFLSCDFNYAIFA